MGFVMASRYDYKQLGTDIRGPQSVGAVVQFGSAAQEPEAPKEQNIKLVMRNPQNLKLRFRGPRS